MPQRGSLLLGRQPRHHRLQQLDDGGKLGVVTPWPWPSGRGRRCVHSGLWGRRHRRPRCRGSGGGHGRGEGGQQRLCAATRAFLELQGEQLFQQRYRLVIAHGRSRRRSGRRSGLPRRRPPCQWPRGGSHGRPRRCHARRKCRTRGRTSLLLRHLRLLHQLLEQGERLGQLGLDGPGARRARHPWRPACQQLREAPATMRGRRHRQTHCFRGWDRTLNRPVHRQEQTAGAGIVDECRPVARALS